MLNATCTVRIGTAQRQTGRGEETTIYRLIRKLKTVLYRALIEPDIKRSFAECGTDTHIDQGGDFLPMSNIHVGSHVSIGVAARFWTTRAQIYIEDYALFGPNVTIVTGDHRKDVVGKHIIELTDVDKTEEDDQDVVIGEGAWIGTGAIILKGVHIGADAIVAAGSVVTKDVAPYTIVGGSPAQFIKNRFSDEELEVHLRALGCEETPLSAAAKGG